MSRNGDIKLNCELGCVAMITRSKFSINQGIIVKVIEPMGLMLSLIHISEPTRPY